MRVNLGRLTNRASEEGTMVRILTKQPTALLNAFYVNGEFQIIGHWAIKRITIEQVEVWDYVGQS